MNWKNIQEMIEQELKEDTALNVGNSKFTLRMGVNKNPTKLGIKIQFIPAGAYDGLDDHAKLEMALQTKLNASLGQFGIQVSKDTDVPGGNTIGFFIPLSQFKTLIVDAIKGV